MAGPTFPWEMFQQAQDSKNRNQQNMYQNIAGIGQGLGQGMGAVGQAMEERKKQAILAQLVQAIKNQNTPIQGPQGYAPPGAGPNAVPAGQTPPANNANLAALGIQAQPSSIETVLPMLMKSQQRPEYMPVPGIMSKTGHPFIFDKYTGKMVDSGLPATPNSGVGGGMPGVRGKQFLMSDLPSRSSPTTAAGAAYQVKVAARQGKSLIAKPGSAQRLGMSQGDLARAVLRNAPTDEAMRSANFSDNIIARVNRAKQQLTSDPDGAMNNPKVRKSIYDMFDELDKSAEPWISNQLKDEEDIWSETLPKNWADIKKREMGENIADIPFEYDTPVKSTTTKDWNPDKENRLQELLRKKQSGTLGN
jgi:hypothetical protein